MASTEHATYDQAAHLLRRAGFGAPPKVIAEAVRAGLVATTHRLLTASDTTDTKEDNALVTAVASLLPELKNALIPSLAVKIWWTHRMLQTPDPLIEKMTLFWHGHFTSNLGRAGDRMYLQNQLLRRHALGNFRTLTLEVAKDPAMLRYLNGDQNFKEHPNENFARELMELYTCGIGNYTEDDVKSAARAFSGWNGGRDAFAFRPGRHDDGPKTFMGQTGNWNGDDIIDMLVAMPATAKRLCTQLFTYFAYPNPEPSVLKALTATYYASGYDIKSVVGAILTSDAFYSPKARHAIIKPPVDFAIGTIRMLGLAPGYRLTAAEITPKSDTVGMGPIESRPMRLPPKTAGLAQLVVGMREMGQDLLEPPTVKGWDGGPHWINSNTLLARASFANRLTANPVVRQCLWEIATSAAGTQESAVDRLMQQLGVPNLSAGSRSALLDYMGSEAAEPPRGVLASVATMIMSAPEYQVI